MSKAKRGGSRKGSGRKKSNVPPGEWTVYSVRIQKQILAKARKLHGTKALNNKGKAWLKQMAEDTD